MILDGKNNTLNNAGVITAVAKIDMNANSITGVSANDGTLTTTPVGGGASTIISAVNGFAIVGTDGNDQVNNTGLVMGSINLGSGVNGFDNMQGAVFDAGATVDVGAGNLVNNQGLFSPGGFQNVFTTTITGNLAQTTTGTYGVDVDIQHVTSDWTNVTGTATMSGYVLANLVNPLTAPGFAKPGTHDLTIVSAAGGETHTNLTLEAFNTAVAGYSLVYPNSTDIDLQYVINYSPAGLTQNQHSVGNAVNAIQAAHFAGLPAGRDQPVLPAQRRYARRRL